jgi:pyruvate,water dikinase
MELRHSSTEKLLISLVERAKELNCLYHVDEILSQGDVGSDEIFAQLIDALPAGWQYPNICRGMVTIHGEVCAPSDYRPTEWTLRADIVTMGESLGEIVVYYTEERPDADEGPFLKEERRLINAVADRIGLWAMQRQLRLGHDTLTSAFETYSSRESHPSDVLIAFLKQTDQDLLVRLTRKMVNHLCWNGVREAQDLVHENLQPASSQDEDPDENRPIRRRPMHETEDLIERTFEVASRHLSEDEVITCLQSWINEEKSTFLIKSLENPGTGLAEMSHAVERYRAAGVEDAQLPIAVQLSLKVALLRRFFVDSLDFIKVAKDFVEVRDFYDLVTNLIYPPKSQGKLGGKGAGLFLASQIVRKTPELAELFDNLKTPKTWYIASDGLLDFIHHNNLDEVYNRKYMEIERVRQDYPHIVQLFKNSHFTLELTKGLASALDDFGDSPLIVRSSSLLEDRVGSAFSGKYKSLFLANQGSKEERLAALQDAIAEVYASVFGPDPIEYRAERGLLDFREEMGILIQEVVGARVGKYFMPAFSGVAFSNNEFRWSPRINREDGLVRLVPGLGTRAVDRIGDDYPVLIAPGQPGLRANVSPDEIIRYSPSKMDVIDIEKNEFVTVDAVELLREYGDDFPSSRQMISIIDGDHIRPPTALEPNWATDDFVVNFEGLITNSRFVKQIRSLLELLCTMLGMPVDIEFASNGEDLYLVQCRTQSRSVDDTPCAIPRDIPRDRIIFNANRFVSNGRVPDITHIVYVDPDVYVNLPEPQLMKDVGRAVGRLNQVLPKRQFILIGPGRWGSRGDIKLGVPITYSDIYHTAMLLEVARQKGDYLPELSFGTHFFQDLVESQIRYLPLYPDDENVIFNEQLLRRAPNILSSLLDEYAHLDGVLRVIEVNSLRENSVLRVLMNADFDEAVGLLTTANADDAPAPSSTPTTVEPIQKLPHEEEVTRADDHWRWRLRMAEQLAGHLDADRYGVIGIYVFGSAKNATAGPGSDIDLIVHDSGDATQRRELATWLDGWSQSLAEMNYLRTGYQCPDGLLDIHYVTDEDIARRTSYAMKIDAVTDAARKLPLNAQAEETAGS